MAGQYLSVPDVEWNAVEFLALNATSVQLTSGLTDPKNRRIVTIQNLGPNAIRVYKDNTVSTTKGIQIAAGGTYTIDAGPRLTFWVRALTADQVANAGTIFVEWA